MIKLIFICSPYAGDIEKNTEAAKAYCRNTMHLGIPIAPHIYFTQFLNDENVPERIAGMRAGLHLLKLCDEIHVYGEPTDGMIQEIELARKLKKLIVYKTA